MLLLQLIEIPEAMYETEFHYFVDILFGIGITFISILHYEIF